jgi:hypothetical protein
MTNRRPNIVVEKKTKTANTPKVIMKSPSSPRNRSPLFPPYGSEEALRQTADYWAQEIFSSMYFDLNTKCHFQRNANAEDASQQINNNLVSATEEFMEQEIANYMACVESFKHQCGEYQALTPENKLFSFVSQIGWKMLAICAHAEVFRRAFREADRMTWDRLLLKIQENALSIESYVHSRGLNWPSLYQNVQDPLPGLQSVQEAVESQLNWKVDHPHHTVITLDGGLKEPIFQGHLQEHIDQSIYDPKNFDYTRHPCDPTKKRWATSEGCYLCGNINFCGCTLQSRAGDLVELIEYPGKGTGIRTLAKFERGDILGVYVGELTKDFKDNIYPLRQSKDRIDEDEVNTVKQKCDGKNPYGKELCYVAPHRYGNWTRFINHSCQPSTQFVVRTIGNRVVTTVEAIRQIFAFEELTLGYGDEYWTGRDCSCGHSNCISMGKESKSKKIKGTRKAQCGW